MTHEDKIPVARTLMDRIRELAKSQEHAFSSSLHALYLAPPYRELVGTGNAALSTLVEALRGGEFIFNHAAMEIMGLSIADLALEPFPSEQTLARAIVQVWDEEETPWHWSAFSPGGCIAGTHLVPVGTLSITTIAPHGPLARPPEFRRAIREARK